MLNKKYCCFFIGITILIISLLIQFYLLYNANNKNKLYLYDAKLMYAATTIKEYLPKNYHYRDMNENSYTTKETLELFKELYKLSQKLEVDYIYTMYMGRDGKIYYTSSSDSLEDNSDGDTITYWYAFDDADDTSHELTYDFFNNPRIIHLNSSDKWGNYRSVYIPQKSYDGSIFLAGADILFENIEAINFKKKLYMFINFIVLLSFSLPLFLAFTKITKKEENYKQKICDLSILDELTKAYNRKYGLEVINEHIKLYENYGIPFSMFMVDIANLSSINKTLGIESGDKILKILVNLLKKTFTSGSKVSRIGEDDFIIIVPNYYLNTEKIYRRKLLEKITFFNKNNLKGYNLDINLAFVKYTGQGLDNFIEIASQNIEFANKNGSLFIVNMQESLELGLKKGEFNVYLQPKINIITKEITFEALLRWNRKYGDYIGPDIFIPIAEKGTLIFSLTNFVIKEVMNIVKENNYNISINLSPVIFQKENFFKGLYNNLKNFSHKTNIKFEIIETSAFSNIEDTIKKINLFKEIGIAFSLDDFGTGYSSLSYLSILPIKEVKVDKSFVEEISEKAENKIIIESIIKLSKVLNFEVVIEGVENIENIDFLINLGCTTFQGYYFDRPLPIEQCVTKVNENCYNIKIEEVFEYNKSKNKPFKEFYLYDI